MSDSTSSSSPSQPGASASGHPAENPSGDGSASSSGPQASESSSETASEVASGPPSDAPETGRTEADVSSSGVSSGVSPADVSPPDASGGDPTEPRHVAEAPSSAVCANCEAPLVGPFCAQCGQRAADRIVPMHEITREWIEDLFEFDIRIFRTLPTFFFKPGRLTKEYVKGRRVRYVRPLRLYLVSSFILFTLLAFSGLADVGNLGGPGVPGTPEMNPPETTERLQATEDQLSEMVERGELSPEDAEAARKALEEVRASFSGLDSLAQSAGEQAQQAGTAMATKNRRQLAQSITKDMNLNFSLSDTTMNRRAEQLVKSKIERTVEDPQAFVSSLIDRGPYLMFLMLPLFALLLKLLYARRSKLYMQHLIFAMHVHALAFLAFSVATLMEWSGVATLHTAAGWLAASPFLYLFIAMAHVYEQGWIKTGVKMVVLLFVYMIILGTAFAVLAVANFLLM